MRMALSTCNVSGSSMATGILNKANPYCVNHNIIKSSQCMGLSVSPRMIYNEKRQCIVHTLDLALKGSRKVVYGTTNPYLCKDSKFLLLRQITQAQNSEVQECIRDCEGVLPEPAAMHCEDYSEVTRDASFQDKEDEQSLNFLCARNRPCIFLNLSSCRGLAEAAKYACNDAKFVNERARNDIVLLSRGITRINDRARRDVAILGSEFLKLDARAREDTGKIDIGVKEKAARLQRIAECLKDKAQTKLKTAAAEHWSDGALEADLRQADLRARRRAMEDAFLALEFVKNIHDMTVRTMYQVPKNAEREGDKGLMEGLNMEKNVKAFKIFPGKVSDDHITAIQDAYWSMASVLSEADGIDYTDPDELELLVATLLDMDAIDGKRGASLLAECSSSPDVDTRQALANALADAPSMCTLGNAGMGALQRLAQDSNPAVAAAASKAIDELKRQWQIGEGDFLVFSVDDSFSDSENSSSNDEIDDKSEKG